MIITTIKLIIMMIIIKIKDIIAMYFHGLINHIRGIF